MFTNALQSLGSSISGFANADTANPNPTDVSEIAGNAFSGLTPSVIGGLPALGTWSFSKFLPFGTGGLSLTAVFGAAALFFVYRSTRREVHYERVFYVPVQMPAPQPALPFYAPSYSGIRA